MYTHDVCLVDMWRGKVKQQSRILIGVQNGAHLLLSLNLSYLVFPYTLYMCMWATNSDQNDIRRKRSRNTIYIYTYRLNTQCAWEPHILL